MNKENDETFVRITNADIFKAQQQQLELIQKNHEINQKQHTEIIQRLDKTNGKVRLNYWIATTAMALIVIVVGILVEHIGK